MALAMYKVRIVANACITRHDRGERTIVDIVDSYTMTAEDRELIVAEIVSKRPDLDFNELSK